MELELVDISKTYNNNDVCAIKSLNYTLINLQYVAL